MSTPKLSLVVAMCNNRGIGVGGQLPWRIKGDMDFFKRITMDTTIEGKQNAVIMGRKTWDSIPAKFRPLPKRLNVVISNSLSSAPDGAHLARSLEDAVELIQRAPLSDQIDKAFVIGGSTIYKMVMESSLCHRIYLTTVMSDFECDVFMPEFDAQQYRCIEDSAVDSSIQIENGLQYKFEVLEKVQ